MRDVPPLDLPAAEASPGGAPAASSDLASVLVRSWLAIWQRTFDCSLALASIGTGHNATLLQVLAERTGASPGDTPPPTETELRMLTDGLRTYLREIGEAATRHALLLQRDLEQMSEALAQTVEPQDPAAPYRRRWKAKP